MQYSTERATAQDGMKMITNSATDIIERLIEGGLEEKYARIILALCGQAPMKASEIGKLVSISRMDAYNSLKLERNGPCYGYIGQANEIYRPSGCRCFPSTNQKGRIMFEDYNNIWKK